MGCADDGHRVGRASLAFAVASIVGMVTVGCRSLVGQDDKTFTGAPGGGGGDGATGGHGGGGCAGADLDVDPKNCGQCGRDCLEGPCSAGRCAPFVLAGTAKPVSIALSGEHVFFGDFATGEILRVGKDGKGRRVVTTLSDGRPGSLAVEEPWLYATVFTNNTQTRVGRVNVDGGTFETLSSGWAGPWSIALDETHVYWTNRYDDAAVVRVAKDDAGQAEVLATRTAGEAFGLALTETALFWTQGDAVWRFDLRGGVASPFATSQIGASSMARDATSVYWFAGGFLRRAHFQGDPLVVELAEVPKLGAGTLGGGAAVDASHVYFTQFGTLDAAAAPLDDAQLLRVPAAGDAGAEVLVDGLSGAADVALDEQAVYWVNEFDGTVTKLAK